jgi:hypothetical protein
VTPALDPIATTLARMIVFGPVMFLGLMMAIKPSSFTSLLSDLEDGVGRFKLHIQGRWPDAFFHFGGFHDAGRWEAGVRVAGVLLVVAGLLGMRELPG